MRKMLCSLLALLCIAILSACGDTAQPTKASISFKSVIKASALTASLNIGGVQMTLALPQGVTPPLNADGSWNEDAIIEFVSTVSANSIQKSAKYYPATSMLEFSVINLVGFSTDDQITLHLVITPGATPQTSDFSVKTYNYFDKDTGASIAHTKPDLTAIIQ